MSTSQRSASSARPGARDDIVATGAAAFAEARASVEGAVADVADRGKEALQGAREVRDTFADALLESTRNRPYATLAVVAGVGFLFGAIWRR